MDWVGYGLFTGSLATLTMGLTWGKNPCKRNPKLACDRADLPGLDPWNSANVLAPLLIGVGLAILLAIHQWKFRTDGLFARHIFSKSRNPAIVLVAVAIEGAGTLLAE